MKRLSLSLCLMLLAACGGDKNPDPTGGSCDQSCGSSANCPLNYVCNDNCCEPFEGCSPDPSSANACTGGKFCAEDFTCKDAATVCDEVGVGATGCQCAILNSAGQLEATGTPHLVLAGTGRRTLQAVLVLGSGGQLPGASFTFTFAGDGFSIDDQDLVGDGTAGSGTVTATVNGGLAVPVTCTATVDNLGAAPVDAVRVYAFNNVSSAAVTGAEVVFTDVTGAELGSRVTTDADGLATSTVDIAGDYNVTVFKAGFNYLSLVGLEATHHDLALPLTPRNNPPTVGGFTGQLDTEHYTSLRGPSDILAGIVAGSVPLTSILNFDLETFIGKIGGVDCNATPDAAGCYTITTEQLPVLTSDVHAALPGGLVLGFGQNLLKGNFDSVGIPGRRYAWGIGGGAKISDLGPLIQIFAPLLAGGTCDCDVTQNACDVGCDCDLICSNVGDIFDGVIPLLSQFATAAKANIPLKEVPIATWNDFIDDDYGPDRVDAAHNFPVLDNGAGEYGLLELRELLADFTDYDAPTLPDDPELGGSEKMEGMLVLTGINATGFGFVPLGLGAGLDCTEGDGACLDRAGHSSAFDGEVNGGKVCFWNSDSTRNRCDDLEGLPNTADSEGRIGSGHLGVFHSPAHSGLENQEWLTIVLSLPLSSFLTTTAIRATGYVLREEPAHLTGTLPNNFMSFPSMPANTFSRTYEFADAGADLHWITVASPQTDVVNSTRWNIYFAAGGGSFVAPAVPAAMADPFEGAPVGQEDITPGFIDVTHVAFDLGGNAGPTLGDLADNNGSTLSDVTNDLQAFAVQNRELDAEP